MAKTRPASILLVEDSDELAEVTRLFLEEAGFEVVCTSCVEDAVAAFRSSQLDLVLSDWTLPDGSGSDLLRQLSDRQPLRVIFLTGHDIDVDEEHSHALCGVLLKPTSPELLVSRIRRILWEHSLGEAERDVCRTRKLADYPFGMDPVDTEGSMAEGLPPETYLG